jgi:hypothetical protein
MQLILGAFLVALPFSRPFVSFGRTKPVFKRSSSSFPALHAVTADPKKTKISNNLQIQESSEVKLSHDQVHLFGKSATNTNNKNLKFLLGGKGANLADMSAIGLSVPPGFTITTEVCNVFHKLGRRLPSNTWAKVLSSLKTVENEMNRYFGSVERPLLVSVRSGAAVSMPGMMDTVLNLGLNDETVKGLAVNFGERFAKVILASGLVFLLFGQ